MGMGKSSQQFRGRTGIGPVWSDGEQPLRVSVLKGLGLPPLLPTGTLPLIFHEEQVQALLR